MLKVYPSRSMPHAIPASPTAYPFCSQAVVSHDPSRPVLPYTTVLNSAAVASSKPTNPTPPETMSGETVGYGEGVYSNVFAAPNFGALSTHSMSYKPAYNGSTDPTQYSTSSVPSSGVSNHTKSVDSEKSHVTRSDSSSHTKVVSNLDFPATIQVQQHDLSQLAADVSCFLWFEPALSIKLIERTYSSANLPSIASLPAPQSTNSVPSEPFRKWLTCLLQTTQVTQNVIILALLFIYRLKRKNPNIAAKPGSEFRLMTVALMLGNKFLDDNTYTNKTWADVSGIPVQEVHHMEVEFLSNMRFGLFTTEQAWLEWHDTLTKFGRGVFDMMRNQEMVAKLALLAPIPSPTKPHSPMSYSPSNRRPAGYQSYNYNPQTITPTLPPQISSATVSPIGPLPESHSGPSRKRYAEDYAQEPPVKRHMPQYSAPQSFHHTAAMETTGFSAASAKGMLPSLTIPQQSMNLPPLPSSTVPTTRAMAMVYPSAHHTPVSQMIIPPIQTSTMSTPSSLGVFDVARQMSPYPISANSSPISANPHSSHLSPSFFLNQRSSPYRPVRQVKTLLHPPQAPTSIYNAPRQVGMDHLQYHSLGQPLNERHVGHVPYFHREAWPPLHQPRQWPQLTTPGHQTPSHS